MRQRRAWPPARYPDWLVTAVLVTVMWLCVAVIVWALTGCGEDNVLTSGRVTDLEYDDPDYVYSQVCVHRDPKTGTCFGYVDNSYYTGPRWYLRIDGIHEDENRSEKQSVTEAEYNSCSEGDHWEKGRGCTGG